MAMINQFQYDVFLNHNSADKLRGGVWRNGSECSTTPPAISAVAAQLSFAATKKFPGERFQRP